MSAGGNCLRCATSASPNALAGSSNLASSSRSSHKPPQSSQTSVLMPPIRSLRSGFDVDRGQHRGSVDMVSGGTWLADDHFTTCTSTSQALLDFPWGARCRALTSIVWHRSSQGVPHAHFAGNRRSTGRRHRPRRRCSAGTGAGDAKSAAVRLRAASRAGIARRGQVDPGRQRCRQPALRPPRRCDEGGTGDLRRARPPNRSTSPSVSWCSRQQVQRPPGSSWKPTPRSSPGS